MTVEDPISDAARALAGHLDHGRADVLLVLGSGLAGVAAALSDSVEVPVDALPGMAASTVPGHAGVLRIGTLAGQSVIAQVGRVHLYEGYSGADVARTVELAGRLGAQTFVVTNAAGGLDPSLVPGDLLAIRDHLNLTGASAHRGSPPVFQDMGNAYDPRLRDLAAQIALAHGFTLREGVYAGVRGPAFETPAEVAMLRTLGADAVGMSTVLEVIAARAQGMRVLGLSSITNVHGRGTPTSHEEVLAVGERISGRVTAVLLDLLADLPDVE